METWLKMTAVTLSLVITAELPQMVALPSVTPVVEGSGAPHALHVEFEGPIEVREVPIATSATHERFTVVWGRPRA